MSNIRALVDEYAELTSTPREELRALPWRKFRRMAQHLPTLRRGRALHLAHGGAAHRGFDWLMDEDTNRLFDEMKARSQAIIEKLDGWLNTKRGA